VIYFSLSPETEPVSETVWFEEAWGDRQFQNVSEKANKIFF
jgi:hypothetical protein